MTRKRRRNRIVWATVAALALFVAGTIVMKGPASVLQMAVRTWDPDLRLDVKAVSFRGGEILLKNVELRLAERREPIFQAEEVAAGIGKDWWRGRLGSLALVSPVVSLDKAVLGHFISGSASAAKGGCHWELGRLEIRGGHLWLQEFGEPPLDVSVGVDGAIERIGTAALDEMHELDLSNIYVAVRKDGEPIPLFGAGQAKVRVSIGALLRNELGGLRVDRGWLLAGEGLQVLARSNDVAKSRTSTAFLLHALDLVDLHVSASGGIPGVTAVSLRINSALRDVGIGTAAADLADKIHQVEFADIEILSPYDPLKRAVTVRSVFAKFTLSGLARQEIEDLILLSPTIYVGEALFEYMQKADEVEAPAEQVRATEGWRVKRLNANFGKLVIAVGGRSQVGLPLTFQSSAENISLSSLAGLNLSLVLTIPSDDYDFGDYNISFKNVRGDILLNYPPAKDANNLVNVVKMDRCRWRNFTGRNLWVSVTFDLDGINGQFGGEAYQGDVSGGFSFLLQPESPWTGWVAGTKLNLEDMTSAVAPQQLVMSGRATMKLEVNGRGPEIDRVLGNVQSLGGGRMVIAKLNEMIEAIPEEWSSLKRELTRVGLETLRDYDYSEAGGKFWFVGKEGQFDLKMKGPSGARNLEVVLHGQGGKDGVWSQKKKKGTR